MPLGWFSRGYVGAVRPLTRALLEQAWLRDRLARSRSTPVEGCTLDPNLAALARLDDLLGQSRLEGATPALARRRIAESVQLLDLPAPEEVRVRALRWPSPKGPLPARLYEPPAVDAPSPGLVYLHGGGWVTGDLDTHHGLCARLALWAGIRVVAVEYRLAPETRFPGAVEDAVAAFRWASEEAGTLGFARGRIAVGGDSAGGNLSAVVSLRTRGEPHRPALAALLYPATDATFRHPSHRTMAEGYFLTRASIDWYFAHYAGGDPACIHDPDLSPLLCERVDGLPPTLVYTAHFDPLRDEGAAWAARLKEAGVPSRHRRFPDLPHGFANMTAASVSARNAVQDVARDLRDAFAGTLRFD